VGSSKGPDGRGQARGHRGASHHSPGHEPGTALTDALTRASRCPHVSACPRRSSLLWACGWRPSHRRPRGDQLPEPSVKWSKSASPDTWALCEVIAIADVLVGGALDNGSSRPPGSSALHPRLGRRRRRSAGHPASAGAATTYPSWLKLVRSGTTLRVLLDGWRALDPVGATTVSSAAANQDVGIAMTSHKRPRVRRGRFRPLHARFGQLISPRSAMRRSPPASPQEEDRRGHAETCGATRRARQCICECGTWFVTGEMVRSAAMTARLSSSVWPFRAAHGITQSGRPSLPIPSWNTRISSSSV